MRKIKYNILDYSIEFIHPIVLNLIFFFFKDNITYIIGQYNLVFKFN